MRDKIKMVSSAGTGHFYTTDKNKRTKPEKLEMKKISIQWFVSMLCTRKSKIKIILDFIKKTRLAGFFYV